MNDRSFRLGSAGKALIAGGLLCLKGSVPTFAVFPAHPTVASKGQVSGAPASTTQRTASGASGTGAGVGFLSLRSLSLAGVSMAIFRRTGCRAAAARRAEPDARRPAKEEEVREEFQAFFEDAAGCGKVACAALISSAKSQCVHPERKDPYLCGDCPRNFKTVDFDDKVCAAAAFVSSAKSQCVHPERKDPYLCGDCPRNGFAKKDVCAAAAFVSSAKTQCVHPDRKDPYLCGDCPRNPKFSNL
mmetsp:Transcript_6444/g.13530  ORF Transcript_6444/g.13530 Transcript_6444/m.13530 type:complete len:244 (+) Transcript_6444:90-821(+)